MSDMGWTAAQVARRRLHERYIGGILLAIVIGLVSVRWADVPKLTDYVGFALTLSGLVLSLLAIGYAIYSNATLDRNVSALTLGIEQLRGLSGNLATATQTLSSEIRNVAAATGALDSRMQSAQGRINEIAEGLQRSPRQRRIKSQPVPHVVGPVEQHTAVTLEEFAETSSINGSYLAYACGCAVLSKKPLNLEALAVAIEASADYLHAMVISLIACGVARGGLENLVVTFDSINGATNDALIKIEKEILAGAASEDEKEPELNFKKHTREWIRKMRVCLAEQGLELPPTTLSNEPPQNS